MRPSVIASPCRSPQSKGNQRLLAMWRGDQRGERASEGKRGARGGTVAGVSSSEAETSRQRSGGGGGGTTAGSGTKHTAAQATRGRSRCCETASRSSPAAQ